MNSLQRNMDNLLKSILWEYLFSIISQSSHTAAHRERYEFYILTIQCEAQAVGFPWTISVAGKVPWFNKQAALVLAGKKRVHNLDASS